MSQVAISEIVSNCRSICRQALDRLKCDIVTALKVHDPEMEILSLVLNKDYYALQGIDTNYCFDRFVLNI